jgi:pilus assembly protein CpaB
MRPGSIMIFVLAFVCAGIAALLVRGVLSGPAKDAPTAQASLMAVPMKAVLVAVREFRAGDRLTPEGVREAGWPAELLPKGSFSSRETLFKGGGERVLSMSVAENAPILAQQLAGESALAGRLHDGMRAITIRVNDASGVGGFVQPEDRVDVLLTQTERPGEAGIGALRAYTKTLVTDARVLAADQQTERKQQTQPPKTVTLEVSEEDAKRLTLASAIGQLSLTLSKGDGVRGNSRVVDLRDVAALPDRPENRVETGPVGPVVSVFRSVERKDYRVPRE